MKEEEKTQIVESKEELKIIPKIEEEKKEIIQIIRKKLEDSTEAVGNVLSNVEMSNLNTSENKPQTLEYVNILPYSNIQTILNPIKEDMDVRQLEYFNVTRL